MIAFDTNILFPSLEPSHSNHERARDFLQQIKGKEAALCEMVLMETYLLVRNAAVCTRPLDGPAAVALMRRLRSNPQWRLLDYPGALMDDIWEAAGQPGFARRRIFDARLAITLRSHGVTDFATANVKDFEGFGFSKVWNPFLT
jgi:uncharacterized protein